MVCALVGGTFKDTHRKAMDTLANACVLNLFMMEHGTTTLNKVATCLRF